MKISNVPDEFIITFGKYRGSTFKELKTDYRYYHWLEENWKLMEKYFKTKPSKEDTKPKPTFIGNKDFPNLGLCRLCLLSTNYVNGLKGCHVCCSPYQCNQIPLSVRNKIKEMVSNGTLTLA